MRVWWEWEFGSLSFTSTSVGLEGLLRELEFRVLQFKGLEWNWISRDGENESDGMRAWWVKIECLGQAFIMFSRPQS